MSNESDGDWVQARTPREEGDQWDNEPSEYGHSVEPEEWDDYASEQSVPVAQPQPRPSADQPEPAPQAPAEPVGEEPVEQEAANAPTADLVAEDVQEHDAALEADRDDYQGEQIKDLPQDVEADHEQQPIVQEPGDVIRDDEPSPYDMYGMLGEPEQEPVRDEADLDREMSAEDAARDDLARDEWTDQEADGREHQSEAETTEPTAVMGSEETLREEPSDQDYGAEETRVVEPAEETVAFEDPVHDEPAEETVAYDESDLEATQTIHSDSDGVAPAGAAAAGAAGAGMAGVYRDRDEGYEYEEPTSEIDDYRTDRDRPVAEETQVIEQSDPYADAEERERQLQEQLAAERAARQQRLGVVETSENASREAPVRQKLVTDKFFGSSGLTILRLVTAAVLGVTAYQILSNISGAEMVLAPTMIPEPRLTAWIVGAVLGFLAIFLVLGLLQRVVGLLLMVYAIGMLVFVRWGAFNPFLENFEGFYGDKELLLAGIGYLLFSLGGGAWGIDGAFRRSRAKARGERRA